MKLDVASSLALFNALLARVADVLTVPLQCSCRRRCRCCCYSEFSFVFMVCVRFRDFLQTSRDPGGRPGSQGPSCVPQAGNRTRSPSPRSPDRSPPPSLICTIDLPSLVTSRRESMSAPPSPTPPPGLHLSRTGFKVETVNDRSTGTRSVERLSSKNKNSSQLRWTDRPNRHSPFRGLGTIVRRSPSVLSAGTGEFFSVRNEGGH